MDLLSCCTVGAAESVPPASGRIALFSIAMESDFESDFLSPALPVVAGGEVIQLVSGLSPDGVVDCAAAAPTTRNPAKTAAATREIILWLQRKTSFSKSRKQNVPR